MKLLPDARIVFASDNPGKIREVRDIFRATGLTVVPQGEFGIRSPEETGTTFRDNAMLKAEHAAAESGLPSMADDSGLAVDALDGRPGVRSARFAGESATDDENVDKLLEELATIADERRGAGFHCTAVLVMTGSEPLCAEGVWRGNILRERRGAGGFGYDPVFLDPVSGRTGAELSREEKNRVSHRGAAFRKLRDLLLAAERNSR